MSSCRGFVFSFLLAALTLISASASAQYTCNDREYLRETLRRLEAQCSGGTSSSCSALGYKGSTPDRAIAACIKAGYGEYSCHSNLTCGSDVNLCSALSYKSTTVEGAIANCVRAGYGEYSCHSNASCSGGATICNALSYKGSSIEQAIESCKKAGYGEYSCHSNASCN